MATKAWFDYATYMAHKLTQMQETYPNEKWTAASLQKAFDDAGYVGDEGAQRHFQKWGHTEDVSPNKYFDAKYYYEAKAIQYYGLPENGGLTKAQVEADMDTYAKNMEGAIKAAGMDAWTHYIKWGNAEGINPSNEFDTSDYMAAKLAALQAAEPSAGWTTESMNAAFKKAGLNALQHFMQYAGKGANEVASTDISDFEVPDSEKIVPETVGDTFTLTTAADTLTGTAKDDAFVAGEVNSNKTLTAGDNLDGGDGTDTLTVSSSAGDASYSGFTAKNIEVLEATSDGNSQTFDLSGTTDLTTLRSINSSADVTFNHVATLANVEATKLTEDANAAKPNITVQYENAAVTGSEDAVSFTLNSSNVGVVKLGSVSDANGGIESLALTANGGDSTVDQIDSDITTLTFTGDKNVKVDAALNTTVKTIDASAATGGLNVAVAGNNVTFMGGAGDDEIDFGASLNASDKVTGGEGNDRLVAEKAGLILASSQVSGVEIIQVADQLTGSETASNSTNTLNAGAYTDATTFELAGGYNAARINDFTSTQNRVDILSANNNGTLTLDEAATEFTLGVGKAGTEAALTANVAFANNKVATLNVVSNGNDKVDTGGNELTAASTALTTVNITGNEDLTLKVAGDTVKTIAGEAATGDLDLREVGVSGNGAAITTGSGDDRVRGGAGKDTISTGSGSDTVYGSTGADTISLGDGADTVIYTALGQSNSANMDTISDFVDGTDKIDLSGLGVTKFGGSFATFDLAQGGTAKGEIRAVFDQSTGRLWVDMNSDGTLSAEDFRVTLSNVSTLSTASVTTRGAAIALTKGDNVGTNGSDLFTTTKAVLPTVTSLDGLEGNDTLEITDAVPLLNLNDLAGDGSNYTLTSIENVVFDAGTTAAVTIHNEKDVVVKNADTEAAPQAVTVILGAATGQTYSGGYGVDTVTLGSPDQTVNGGAGADVFNASITNLANSELNGGAGADTLNITEAGTIPTSAKFSGIETLALGNKAVTMTVTQWNSFDSVTQGTGVGVTFSDSGTATVTTAATTVDTYVFSTAGNTLSYGNDATKTPITVTGNAGADTIDLSGNTTTKIGITFAAGAGADNVIFSAEKAATLTNYNGGAGIDSLTIVGDNATAYTLAGTVTDVENIVATGKWAAGNGLTLAAGTANNATTVDLSGTASAIEFSMAAQTAASGISINALNGYADTLTLSTAAAGAQKVQIDHGDTVTLAANLAAATPATITITDNDDTSTTTAVNVNSAAFTAVAKSLLIGVDDVKIVKFDGLSEGSVGARLTGTTIEIDVDADGAMGTGDVTVSFAATTAIALAGIENGDLNVTLS